MADHVFLKKEFLELCKSAESILGSDRSSEIGDFVLTCALKIWASDKTMNPGYKETISHVFPGMENINEIQIDKALECFVKDNREIKMPGFFKEMQKKEGRTEADDYSEEATPGSERFLEILEKLLNDLSFTEGNGETTGIVAEIRNVMEGDFPIYSTDLTYMSDDENEDVTDVNSVQDKRLAKEEKAASSEEKQAESRKQEEKEPTLEELLEELDGLVGLDNVKADIHSMINFIKVCKIREERGFKTPDVSLHLVFTGNPGTGKTTVARMLASIYKAMGILSKGQLIETDRSGLVAGYTGQTAIKTQKVIKSAMGGVLFIDEAYSLANDEEDTFGREAVETVLKAMEDHRDDLIVIVAGYNELMHKFIESNPGLSSRFNKYFLFEDYTGEEMIKIFERFVKKGGYSISEETSSYCLDVFNKMYELRDENFGNARTVRNVFEKAIARQADRLALKGVEDGNTLSDEELQEIRIEDIKEALGAESEEE